MEDDDRLLRALVEGTLVGNRTENQPVGRRLRGSQAGEQCRVDDAQQWNCEYILHSGDYGFHWGLKNPKPFIENGARIYVDCNHPEYASPETTNPLDAMMWDKAGEYIIPKNLKKLKVKKLRLFKNNIDSYENSYGSHESYCMERSNVDKDKFYNSMLGFLVTRIIFAGSGSIK